jgi:exopolyphosphatase/guanosine-5'-triphosphate,3'-diphosphate pyrophosphatase
MRVRYMCRMMQNMSRHAAIDCGTNSIRILIADVIDGRVVDVVREMRTVRLGEGVDASGEFSAAALQRTFMACEEYADLLTQYPVESVRFIATSASRDVSNRADFVKGVQDRLGVTVEVIAGTEEAELSFLGAVRGLDPALISDPVLVADIGGGSTEYVLGHAATVRISRTTSTTRPSITSAMSILMELVPQSIAACLDMFCIIRHMYRTRISTPP